MHLYRVCVCVCACPWVFVWVHDCSHILLLSVWRSKVLGMRLPLSKHLNGDMIFPCAALKHSQSGSQHASSASQVASNLINVRSIAAHFRPKIDAWSAANQVVTITQEQVSQGARIFVSFICDQRNSVAVYI